MQPILNSVFFLQFIVCRLFLIHNTLPIIQVNYDLIVELYNRDLEDDTS